MKTGEQCEQYTIKEWADIWVEVYAAPRCKPSTLQSYIDCRKRMKSAFRGFEEMQLEQLRPFEFQRCLNVLAETYSKSTISHIRSVYNQVYAEAVHNGLCTINPVSDARVPQNAATKKVTALSQEEQAAFEAALKKLPVTDQFILQTFLLTGLRRGELEELTWNDWDKNRNVLIVRKSKTKSGIREVPVIPEVTLILIHLSHLKRSNSCPYIFSLKGQKLPDNHIRWICKKASRLAGIRHVHPHMLRHTFASRMVEHKVDPKSLASIIGHADVAFTMRTYVDVDQTHHLRQEMMRISRFPSKDA